MSAFNRITKTSDYVPDETADSRIGTLEDLYNQLKRDVVSMMNPPEKQMDESIVVDKKSIDAIMEKMDFIGSMVATIKPTANITQKSELFYFELPTLNTDKIISKSTEELGNIIHDYLQKTDERFMMTVLSVSFKEIGGGIYKSGEREIYCQYEFGSNLWRVFMFIQWVLLPTKLLSYDKTVPYGATNMHTLEKRDSIDAISCLFLDGKYTEAEYIYNRMSSISSQSRRYDIGINIYRISSKLFTLKIYELALNALSSKGIHADTFTDLSNNIIPVIKDNTISYNYTVAIYRISGGSYHDFFTFEKVDLSLQNAWYASGIMKDIFGKITPNHIQIIIYKTLNK